MKKTPLKKVGKIGKRNAKANKHIEDMFIDLDIYFCEVCPVLHEMGLLTWQCLQSSSNAHRNSRHWYRDKPHLLSDFKQVAKACMLSHKYIDDNPDIREEVFMRLRGE